MVTLSPAKLNVFVADNSSDLNLFFQPKTTPKKIIEVIELIKSKISLSESAIFV